MGAVRSAVENPQIEAHCTLFFANLPLLFSISFEEEERGEDKGKRRIKKIKKK